MIIKYRREKTKKNLIKVSALVMALVVLSSTSVVFAFKAYWSDMTTTTTPNWGGIAYNNSTSSGKATTSGKGTIYTKTQSTALNHSIALTYLNINNNKVIGSEWKNVENASTEYPQLNVTTYGLTFWSAAKSNAIEWTNNTTVTYKFSADKM